MDCVEWFTSTFVNSQQWPHLKAHKQYKSYPSSWQPGNQICLEMLPQLTDELSNVYQGVVLEQALYFGHNLVSVWI